MVLGETVSSPNTLLCTENTYATLVMGFPELEYSGNEVIAWPRIFDKQANKSDTHQQKFVDQGILSYEK